MDGTEHPYPTPKYPSLPLPPNCSSVSEICLNAKGLIIFKCHLNIRKHRPWAYIYILGFIKLSYFGSAQFRKIYLVERICICIWIDVFVFVFESMLNKIFVFVFAFEKSNFLYLYLYLIKRIWPQPCSGLSLQLNSPMATEWCTKLKVA